MYHNYSKRYGLGYTYFIVNESAHNMSIYGQFLIDTFQKTNYIMYSIYYKNNTSEGRVLWGSQILSNFTSDPVLKYSLTIGSDYFNFSLVSKNDSKNFYIHIFPFEESSYGGINETIAENTASETTTFSNYSLGVETFNTNETLNNFTITQMFNFSNVVFIPTSILNNKVFTPVFYSISKGYKFEKMQISGNIYPVFFSANTRLVEVKQSSCQHLVQKLNISLDNMFVVTKYNSSILYITTGSYIYISTIVYLSVFIFTLLMTSTAILAFSNFRKKYLVKI
jgi:hypothetical protein